jgi:hypothetical protein
LHAVLDVEKHKGVPFEEGFRIRYCHRHLRHSVSAELVRLLGQYIRWAEIVRVTGVYNFPKLPTLFHCQVLKKPVGWSPRGGLQCWEGSSRRTLSAIWDSLWSIIKSK